MRPAGRTCGRAWDSITRRGYVKQLAYSILIILLFGLTGCAPSLRELIKQQAWEKAEKRCEAKPLTEKKACYAELLTGAREYKAENKIQMYIEKNAENMFAQWKDRVLYYEGGYLPGADKLQTVNKANYVPIIKRYLKIVRYIGKGPKAIKHGEGRFYQAAEKYFNLKRRLKDYGFKVEEMDFRRFNKTAEWKEAQEQQKHNIYLNIVFQYKIETQNKSSTYCLSTAAEMSSVQRPRIYKKHLNTEQIWLYSIIADKNPDTMRVSQQIFYSDYYQLKLDRHVCEVFIQMQDYKRKAWNTIIKMFPERFKDMKNVH